MGDPSSLSPLTSHLHPGGPTGSVPCSGSEGTLHTPHLAGVSRSTQALSPSLDPEGCHGWLSLPHLFIWHGLWTWHRGMTRKGTKW